MASARTLKRRAQRRARKNSPRRIGSAELPMLDRITRAFYTDSDVIKRVLAQSILYDKFARREPMDVEGRAYTYSLYTNPKAHLEP